MIGLLGDSIDEALIQGIAAVAMGGGDLGGKTVTLTENNTYTYDPQDEVPPLDGYNAVSVTVNVPDRYDEGYSDGYDDGYDDGRASIVTLGSKSVSITANDTYTYNPASDNLDGYDSVTVNVAVPQYTIGTRATITENGTYAAASESPPLDGYSAVTVAVPTYEEEYEEMLACQQQIAAKLGLEPPYDCEDIEEAIDELDGYTFPEGTPYNDVETIVAGSPHELKDNQNGGRISWTCGEEPAVDPYWGDGIRIFGRLRFIYPDDTIYILCEYNPEYPYARYPNYHFISATYSLSYSQVDGSYSASVTVIIDANGTIITHTETHSGTCNGLIGYGDSSHTFSVKNKE